MKYQLVALLILISLGSIAQPKLGFSSQNYTGLLTGEHGSKYQLQTIDGFRYKSWFAGVGVGLDWYYQRSIPLFVSLNKEFLKSDKRTFFASADGGINYPWGNDNLQVEWGYHVAKLLNGPYWGVGFGYKVGFGKKNDAILLHIGYSYKYSGETTELNATTGYLVLTPYDKPTNRYDYRLRRLSLKLGYQF